MLIGEDLDYMQYYDSTKNTIKKRKEAEPSSNTYRRAHTTHTLDAACLIQMPAPRGDPTQLTATTLHYVIMTTDQFSLLYMRADLLFLYVSALRHFGIRFKKKKRCKCHHRLCIQHTDTDY